MYDDVLAEVGGGGEGDMDDEPRGGLPGAAGLPGREGGQGLGGLQVPRRLPQGILAGMGLLMVVRRACRWSGRNVIKIAVNAA